MADKMTDAERFGRNIGTNMQNIGAAAQGAGSGTMRVADYATFQLGNALAGGANTARDVLGGMKAQMRGGKATDYGPTYEGKTLTSMSGGQKPAAAPAAGSAKPGATGMLPAMGQQPPLAGMNDLPGIAGVKDWSGIQMANTGFAAPGGAQPPSTPLGEKLRGVHYDGGNADIYATSTRKDGKFNSFTGVGDPARPNWENRPENRQDHLAAVARADKDKAAVVQMARNYAAQGDREGAARMALNDPVAAAAVENEVKKQQLTRAALAGNATAGGVLRQMMADETALTTTGMTTATQQRGQDIGLQGTKAQVGATRYGADVGAATADKQMEVDKQKFAAAADAAVAGKSGANRKAAAQAAYQEMMNNLLSPTKPDGTSKSSAEFNADLGLYDRASKNPMAYMYAGGMVEPEGQ